MKRVVSFDIDGVLCNEHETGYTPYPERTPEYYNAKKLNDERWPTLIKALRENGCHICFTTSRAASAPTVEWLDTNLQLGLPTDEVHVFMGVSTPLKLYVLREAMTGFMGGKEPYTKVRLVHFDDKLEQGLITTTHYATRVGEGVATKVGVTPNYAYPEIEKYLLLYNYLGAR